MVQSKTKSLEVRDLTVEFRVGGSWTPVVTDVSFHVAPGEIVGLVGESGSGKSVTSLATMGLVHRGGGRISNGSVNVNGTDLTMISQRQLSEIRGRDISMIFQEPSRALNPSIRVGNQIIEMIRRHQPGTSKQRAFDHAVEMLERVHIPQARKRMSDYPHELSGGMCQRVMIAMALSCSPDFLIADEPTTALDATVQARVLELLREIQQDMGLGILMITHDLGVVAEVCDRAMIMYAGQLVEQGPVSEIFSSPAHPYTSGLLAAIPSGHAQQRRLPFIPGMVPAPNEWPRGCHFAARCEYARSSQCSAGPLQLTPEPSNPGKREVRCARLNEITLEGVQQSKIGAKKENDSTLIQRTLPKTKLVEVTDLSKQFVRKRNIWGKPTETFSAVDKVNLEIFTGETLAIVGESGAGKSTMGRMLLRLEEPDTGRIIFDGDDVSQLTPTQLRSWRSRAQMVFQDPYNSLNPRHTVGAAVREALDVHNVYEENEREEYVADLFKKVGLKPEQRDRYPYEFSGGQLQRVAIARALSTSPSLIVCDEPVAALDMSIRAQILNLMADLQDELGIAYAFVTHDLSLVRAIADRVVVMRQGQVVETGTVENIFSNPRQEYTRQLLDAIPNPFPKKT